jgi:hypothetical protein
METKDKDKHRSILKNLTILIGRKKRRRRRRRGGGGGGGEERKME